MINNISNVVTNIVTTSVEETFRTGCRFVGLTYTNEAGETSKYNLLMGVELTSLYKSDLRSLKSLRSTLEGVDLIACDELISSITESLEKGIGNNSAYTLKGYYTPITTNGEVKVHTNEAGEKFLYLRGYVIKKTVLVKGVYPTVKSSPKTLAKNRIKKGLKNGKLRTFKLNLNVLHSIRLNGLTVEIN
jgi:hypothetical protein